MRYLVLATDYDGTLAHEGEVNGKTLAALERLRASGRKLVLVTGRLLPDLQQVCPHLNLFHRVVAENGALLYRPETREQKALCEVPENQFIALLQEQKVPLSVGHCIVSTQKPHEAEVLMAIRDSGLDLQVIFNRDAVMVMPSGVNKASGLKAALLELGLSPHNMVAVGDAENDHSLLRMAECSVAVANALPALKEHADVVLAKPCGEGVTELIECLLEDDLQRFDARLKRHWISVGEVVDDHSQRVLTGPRQGSILVAGSSGSGKSTTVTGILEQLIQQQYQFCLLDPEGDYQDSFGVLAFGTPKEPPDTQAAFRALESPQQSVLVNLLGVTLDARPAFFSSLLAPLEDLRLRTGRPHWVVVDEAHHMLPSSWSPANSRVSELFNTAIFITVHPEHVAKTVLDHVSVAVAVGKHPLQTIRSYCQVVEIAAPAGKEVELAAGEALVWFRQSDGPPLRVKAVRSARERRRHLRQYAEGELSPEESFYFLGPEAKLRLRAQNLKTFMQLAEGVDDATWMHHLRRGDYSFWFKTMIKDAELAQAAAQIEGNASTSPHESREQIKEAITTRYTAPA